MIPDYDPANERRGKPKKAIKEVEGIQVGTGATKKVIPPEDIWKLASIGCNNQEIADWFGIDKSTLEYNFNGYMTKARIDLKKRLRMKQIEVALGGHPTMLIWLGKQYLGQSESPISGDTAKVLPWTDTDTDTQS